MGLFAGIILFATWKLSAKSLNLVLAMSGVHLLVFAIDLGGALWIGNSL
jgi:hypothetical protein